MGKSDAAIEKSNVADVRTLVARGRSAHDRSLDKLAALSKCKERLARPSSASCVSRSVGNVGSGGVGTGGWGGRDA